MIKVTDNFLSESIFKELQDYCKNVSWQLVTAGEKQFSILPTPENILPYLHIDGQEIILTFIRRAYKGFDDRPRIHADYIIQGKHSETASVLYINDSEGVTPNGTQFFQHIELGEEFEGNEAMYNYLILNESNDESKWIPLSKVEAKPNRLLRYKSNLFHAKYPNEITAGERIVLVVFYCKL